MARILIIDDEDSVRTALGYALVRKGHHVFEARNGIHAERTLRDSSADLIVTDIIMPERDGLETIIALQKKHPEIPVIAMTGAALNSDLYLKVAKALGAVRILSKPFSVETLVQTVEEVLE